MTYADTDFWVALVKNDDWLKERATEVMAENEKIETSITTFIELSLILGRYDIDREKALSEVLEIAETDFEDRIVFQAINYMEEGLNVFDAFQTSHAGSRIISSDKEFDKIGIERLRLEKK